VHFLRLSAVAGVATVCGAPRAAADQAGGGNGMPKLTPPEKPAELNLCLQWGGDPGGEIKENWISLRPTAFTRSKSLSGDWADQKL
jgi:hypothetical protein